MDPCIGDKLYTYFYQLGLMEINAKFIQPIYSTEEERSIIPQFFNEVKDYSDKNKLMILIRRYF